jgi:4-hydroxy-tetrahydrodipicolinate synthase
MFQGAYVAIVTPFTEHGEIDYVALTRLVDWQIESGIDGIVVLGTTGESPAVSRNERVELIRFVVKQVNRRVSVIVGSGTNCTKTSIELTQEVSDLGADAALIVTPYYNRPPQEALLTHFRRIAEVDIPQMLYNVPARTGCDLLPETVAQLAVEKNIVAIKDASGDIKRIKWLRQQNIELDLLSGEDTNLIEFLNAGGNGIVSVTANILPKETAAICKAFFANNEQELYRLWQFCEPIHRALLCETNPIPIKFALAKMGLIHNQYRLPLMPLNDCFHTDLLNQLENANLLEDIKCIK